MNIVIVNHQLTMQLTEINGLGPIREKELKGSWQRLVYQLDLLITFDRGRISGHRNHKSIAFRIEYYIEKSSKTPLINEILTASFIFEFSSIIVIFRPIIKFLPRLFRSLFSTKFPFIFSSPNDQRILFVSSPFRYFKGLKAVHVHRSQMI
ncbi:unnamed protein product, partial [Rotaria sp. Silwood1]